jgi:hypothetical protein
VNDLAIAALDPDIIIKMLETKYKLRLKGVGPITFCLGCDFYRDKDGTLSYGPKSYIKKMIVGCKRMFGGKPKEYSSPL